VGGVDYITKPFQFKEVLARVASQLTLVRQRRQIEAIREQDRQYFESLDTMKNQFISMATHDLRNPLNVIKGYTALLKRINCDEDGLLGECIDGIEQSLEKMRLLVADMLDLAKLEKRVDLDLKSVWLNDFLQDALAGFDLMAAQKDVLFIYRPPAQDVGLEIDPGRMARAIDNLVSNAIKYTPSGGRVEVVAQTGSNFVLIHVIDTGMGIPEKDLPHLFDAFYRVERNGEDDIEGTGLGLSIVKTIVEQHGGQIVVESESGVGSAFSILLT
jgi:two-component system sensor histidine kinase VicK